jgi:hypothetical protein
MFEDPFGLPPIDTGKPLQELVDCGPVFEVLE